MQDWFHSHKSNRRPEFRPYVPQILPTVWYKDLEKHDKEDTMWTMWYLYYMYIEQLYVVHSNLVAYTGETASCLSVNRKEIGLHYKKKGQGDLGRLLKNWRNDFTKFPKLLTKVSTDGSFVNSNTY